MLIRRNLDGSDERYALSNARADTPLPILAAVGATRPAIETLFQQGTGEAGLDQYEVRGWHGWHHHVALAPLAAAFLLTLLQDWGRCPSSPCRRAAACCAPSRPSAPGPSATRSPGSSTPSDATRAPSTPIRDTISTVNRRYSTFSNSWT